MSSYDGAETCELVGIYILHKLADRTKNEGTGLYWDDGLILLHKHNRRQIDKPRKGHLKTFQRHWLQYRNKNKFKDSRFSRCHIQPHRWHISPIQRAR